MAEEKLKIVSKDGITSVFLGDKEIPYVTSIKFKQDIPNSVPEVAIQMIIPDVEMEIEDGFFTIKELKELAKE